MRLGYAKAVAQFLAWCEERQRGLKEAVLQK